jgi:hypothetical protein
MTLGLLADAEESFSRAAAYKLCGSDSRTFAKNVRLPEGSRWFRWRGPALARGNYRAFDKGREAPIREPKRRAHHLKLRSDDVSALRLDLNDREAGRIPAAAERFDQQDASDEALPLDHGELLFVLQ